MLFTLLLDNTDNKSPPDYWSIFYDLHVTAETLEVIRNQANKLVEVSRNLKTWSESEYDRVIRMVNSETLSLLQEYWTKYAFFVDPDRLKYHKFKNQRKEIYEITPGGFETQGLQMLARSFGARLVNSLKLTELHVNHFWTTGSVDKTVQYRERRCNPLAIYSSTAGDRFAIHYRTNPLAGFHLASAITRIASGPDAYKRPENSRNVKDIVFAIAKAQFQAWCRSFQKLAQKARAAKSKNGCLRIRFHIGDAVNFCIGYHKQRFCASGESLNIYSRPWSVQPLRFDGEGYMSGSYDRAPWLFNVIDTSNLADDVGFLNLLTSTVPLLEQSAASILYTESMRSYPADDSKSLIAELFCGDISSMCVLFGVLPAPYITGVTARAKDEAYIDDTTLVLNRVPWKLATSADPSVNLSEAKLSSDPEKLANLLCDIYLDMFEHESANYFERILQMSTAKGRMRFPQPHYSRPSYAALLAFLKSRIAIDWEDFMECVAQRIEADTKLLAGKGSVHDLFLQFQLFDVGIRFPLAEEIDTLVIPGYPRLSTYRHDQGLLKHKNPPKITCLIISIPRRKLRVLYRSCVEDGHRINAIFELSILAKSFRNTYSSVHPIFGKLTPSEDGQNCSIERDANGWFGTADLHVCAYVPTYMLLIANPRDIEVSIRLQQEVSTALLLREILGVDLELFKARLLSSEYVHLVESLPGLAPPNSSCGSLVHSALAVSNDTVEVTYPVLIPKDKTLTTRISIKGKAEQESLKGGAAVTFNYSSLCTVTVKCGNLEHVCNFPFPIAANLTRIRIARKSGWIEVIATLLPPQINGTIAPNPLPIIRDKRYGLSPWNTPYVNFRQLPKVATSEYASALDRWMGFHLAGTFSDFEHNQMDQKGKERGDVLVEFKRTILSIFDYITIADPFEPCVIAMAPSGDLRGVGGALIFFVTGMYMDSNSHGIIADAYVVPANPSMLIDDPSFMPIFMHVTRGIDKGDTMPLSLHRDVFMFWKGALMGMAERCRTWEHTNSCEFAQGVPSSIPFESSPLCSCGIGKVGKDFTDSKWKEVARYATRVAISPMFAAPYIESARGGPLSRTFARSVKEEMFSRPASAPPVQEVKLKCEACDQDGVKKCGACGEVYYCSRDCQRNDWKKHKMPCQKIQQEQRAKLAV